MPDLINIAWYFNEKTFRKKKKKKKEKERKMQHQHKKLSKLADLKAKWKACCKRTSIQSSGALKSHQKHNQGSIPHKKGPIPIVHRPNLLYSGAHTSKWWWASITSGESHHSLCSNQHKLHMPIKQPRSHIYINTPYLVFSSVEQVYTGEGDIETRNKLPTCEPMWAHTSGQTELDSIT